MTKDLTTGKIMPILIRFTIPLVLGNLFQLTYNAVDSIIVGHFVGKEALAAVGICNPISTLMILFLNGLWHGCQHFNGNAVWGKRLRHAAPPDQYHHALRRYFFVDLIHSMYPVCKTDPDLNAGGCRYFIPHNRILTDHLFRIGLYFSVQLFFRAHCVHSVTAISPLYFLMISAVFKYFRGSVFCCRVESRQQRLRGIYRAE